MVDAALARARARALGANKSPSTATVPKRAPSGRTVVLQDGTKVPEEYYDLAPADQQRLVELIKQREAKKADENLALQMTSQALDWVDQTKAKWSKERSELMDVIAGLTARVVALEQQDTTIQIEKSNELTEQLASTSEATLSAANVEVSLRNQTAASRSEVARQGVEHRERLEAEATAIDALSGSVKSSTFLMQERGNAVEAQVAAMEPRVQKLDVSIQELKGKTDAWTDPITRAEVNTMATEAVAEQWRQQLPAMVDAVAEEMQLQFPDGIHAGRRDSEYVRRQRADAAVLAEQRQGGR